MSVTALITTLQARGVALVPDGTHLRVRPVSRVTHQELEELRVRKLEVLQILRQPDHTPRVCFCCKGSRFWLSTYGQTICGACHPPAAERLVAEWVDDARPEAADV